MDKLIIAKFREGNNSEITCDELMILHSTLSLSVFKVSFNYLQYVQDMLRTNFLLQKLKMNSNPINTNNKISILAFCIFSDGPL